jgi:hypothetical protein
LRAPNGRPPFPLPSLVWFLSLSLTLAGCAGRRPVLEPPAGVEAVEGHGSASIQGEETALKGKFSFVFRKPGRGRIDVSGPFGTTAYFLLFEGDSARLVVPSKKIYAEEPSATLMGRFLGFELGPDEVLSLLSGQWPERGPDAGAGPAWALSRDGGGHVVRGERGGFVFEIPEFFPGTGVPRSVRFSGAGSSGRMKVLSLGFNPALRPEAFGTAFLEKYTRRTWGEMQDILRNER